MMKWPHYGSFQLINCPGRNERGRTQDRPLPKSPCLKAQPREELGWGLVGSPKASICASRRPVEEPHPTPQERSPGMLHFNTRAGPSHAGL